MAGTAKKTTSKTAKRETPVAKSKVPSVPPIVEEVLGTGTFSVDKFVECFDVLVEAAGSAVRLRQLVLGFALTGRLSSADDKDGVPLASVANGKAIRAEYASAKGPLDIPQRWVYVPVGLIADCVLGKMLDKAKHTKGTKRPYLRNSNVRWFGFDLTDVLEMYFEDDELERYGTRSGDVLICEGGEPGRAAVWADRPSMLIQKAIHRVRFRGDMVPQWLVLNLRHDSWSNRLDSHFTGSGIKHFTGKSLSAYTIPVPPLAEQKRIVARVDQLMTLIDELEAKQTRKRELGARFTQASLEALTTAEGPEEFDAAWKRVVENWDTVIDRVEKVGVVKDCVLQLATSGRLSPRGPSEWKRSTIADVADCRLGKMLDKVKNRGVPRPYLRNTNVHWFRLELGDIKQMPFEDSECGEYELRSGDLVVCEGGHGIGRTAVWRGEIKSMMFQKALHRLRPHSWMDGAFLAYQLKVAADTGVMARYFTGAGIPHLTGRRLAEMEILVPPIAEQKRIVSKVEHLVKICDDIDVKLSRIEAWSSRLVEAVVHDLIA